MAPCAVGGGGGQDAEMECNRCAHAVQGLDRVYALLGDER